MGVVINSRIKEDTIDTHLMTMTCVDSHILERILAITGMTTTAVADRRLLRSDDTILSTRTVAHRLLGNRRPFIQRP